VLIALLYFIEDVLTGTETIMTKVSFHPLTKARTILATKVPKKKMNIPIFSPMPSWSLIRSLSKKIVRSFPRICDLLCHPRGKICSLVSIVPADVLPHDREEEKSSDAKSLVLSGSVEAHHKYVREEKHAHSNHACPKA